MQFIETHKLGTETRMYDGRGVGDSEQARLRNLSIEIPFEFTPPPSPCCAPVR